MTTPLWLTAYLYNPSVRRLVIRNLLPVESIGADWFRLLWRKVLVEDELDCVPRMFSSYQSQWNVFSHVQVRCVSRCYHFLGRVVNVWFVRFHSEVHGHVLIMYHSSHSVYHVQLLSDTDDEGNPLVYYSNVRTVRWNARVGYVVELIVRFRMKQADRPKIQRKKEDDVIIGSKCGFLFSSHSDVTEATHTYVYNSQIESKKK